MLSDTTIALVKATVPALRARGEDITRLFYEQMLRDHPELRAFFNASHQREGTQARALAGAVLAYAAHIDELEAIAGALPRIIQKHAALGIEPQHYPIVGQCLLSAIREVLGPVATDEILAAWAQAYGGLAELLIQAEEQVYASHAAAPGGWRGLRQFRLVRRQVESAVITSFYFEAADGQPLLAYQPGQYLTLVLDIAGQEVRRNYSLSDAPGRPWYRISVKREPGGLASNWLHDHLQPGMSIAMRPPAGEFVLDAASERPLVLLTAGVGITPAMSMLESSVAGGRTIHFIHAALHSGVHAFRERVNELAAAHANLRPVFFYDEPRDDCPPHIAGRVSRRMLEQVLPHGDVDLYFVGPKNFMRAVLSIAGELGIPAGQTRYEFFGPLEALTPLP